MATVETLIGRTCIQVIRRDAEIIFVCDDGKQFKMYHYQDCCECVDIEDINGELSDLEDSPIVRAEESTNTSESKGDSETWTFYLLSTAKGSVTIRWHGTSNGYYSESVDFEEINNGRS